MIGTRNGYWLIDQAHPTPSEEPMDRDMSNHPASADVLAGNPLTDDQLAALTPEQVEKLTSGEPLPIDPRSPLLVPPNNALDTPRSVTDDWSDVEAPDGFEGNGDGARPYLADADESE